MTAILIPIKEHKFLITSSPETFGDISFYGATLKTNNINTVISLIPVSKKLDGFDNYLLTYDDGDFPPESVTNNFDKIINHTIKKYHTLNVAIHCKAGLGRSPTLVAYFLIKFLNYQPIDAINYMRNYIPHCINTRQLTYLLGLQSNNILNKKKFICC